ncbi:putative phage protein (D protein) [Escherichia coli]|nr:putative phage protein (D protein) [Escherichia coli]SRA20573.1 putative phage protein (D protein) [Escherichia coli]SRA25552.1 putative phage protein (D protein) [Escherichia coli]SRA40588.1 putative phage protein (D protein) [Escherichia coli]SRA41138.1 putative phage protein (D protein) [Escherichia coli]
MAMPRKLKLMNVFLNGYSYQGVAKSVTLPKLTRKLENYRGAGMNGSAPVDLGLDDDALSMEWSLGGFPDSVIWELYAATGVDAVPIRFAGSYQRDDTGETVAVEVVMRGRQKEIDTGEGKQGEAREGEYMAGEADNVFALTTVYATKAQAMRAAQAKWDKLQRGVAEFSISLATGRADIYTETPVKVSGFKRVIDEQDWTITKVTHFLNNSGFTTSLELEVRLSDVEYETEDDE